MRGWRSSARTSRCVEDWPPSPVGSCCLCRLTSVRCLAQKRPGGGSSLDEETFEKWMDAFEKEALRKNPPPPLHDEEVEVGFSGVAFRRRAGGGRKGRYEGASHYTPCCVCWHTGGHDRNSLLFCARCHLAVHRECYGVEKKRGGNSSRAPQKAWFCTHCEEEVRQAKAAAPKTGEAAAAAAAPAAARRQVVPGWGVGNGECL